MIHYVESLSPRTKLDPTNSASEIQTRDSAFEMAPMAGGGLRRGSKVPVPSVVPCYIVVN